MVLLVRYHDSAIMPDQKSVKKALRRLGEDPGLFRRLCALKRADGLAHAPGHQRGAQHAAALEEVLDEILGQESPYRLADLAVSGSDLLAAGIEEGPLVGEVLAALLDAVIDEQVPNDHDALIGLALSLAR